MKARLGGLHSAPLLLWSADFAPIAERQAAGEWDALGQELGGAGRRLAQAGAKALLICTNTMHRLHAEVEAEAGVPAIHIADATGAALRRAGRRRPALLGTRFTMVRIPTQTSRRFRCIPAGDSDGSQPLIPTHSSHP